MNTNQNKPQSQGNLNNNHQIVIQKGEMFSGPVPPPEIMERYEKIYPGSAKIIFEEWDGQVKHRQSIEKSVIKTDNTKSLLGVIFGFIIVMAVIIAGVYTALRGFPIFGGGLSLAGLAMLATAFITSRKQPEKPQKK
ncbi:MAG: DUF2335 domain-containing protein [Candidatus Paceibacterota bacterium]